MAIIFARAEIIICSSLPAPGLHDMRILKGFICSQLDIYIQQVLGPLVAHMAWWDAANEREAVELCSQIVKAMP